MKRERAELEQYNPASFNEAFINAFKHTTAFELWDRTTDEVIFDLVEPKSVFLPPFRSPPPSLLTSQR